MSQTKAQLLGPVLGDSINFDSGTLFVDTTNNRVGIGTTIPGAKLDVAGDIKLSAADAEIEFNTGGVRLKGRANALSIHTGGGLDSETSEQVRINTTGVGIGTTNPTAALQITNATATSLTDAAIWLSGAGGSIMLDDGANKRISWNDGGGNLSIRGGNYYNGGTLYVKAPGDSNGGATQIVLSQDGADGNIGLNVAPIGVPGQSVTWTNSFYVYSTATIASRSSTDTTTYSNGARLEIKNTSNTANNFANLSFVTANGNDSAAIWSVISSHTAGSATGNLIFGTSNAAGAATEKVRITEVGNVGIGTTNPPAKFAVSGTTAGAWASVLSNPSNRTSADYQRGFGTSHPVHIIGNNDGTTDGENALLVLSSGDVTPSAGDTLGIIEFDSPEIGKTNGNASLKASIASVLEGSGGSTGGFGGNIQFLTRQDNSSGLPIERVRIAADGKVGIGTNNPIADFQIGPGNFTGGAGTNAGFAFDVNGQVLYTTYGPGGGLSLRANRPSVSGGGDIFLGGSVRGDYLANSAYIATANTIRLIVNGSGNVGIGTTNPSDNLHVNGVARASSYFISNLNTNVNGLGSLNWVNLGPADADASRATAVQIGDVVGAKYAINCGGFGLTFSKHVSSGNGSWAGAFAAYATSGTDAAPVLYVNNRIGIGTTNPGQKLTLTDGNVSLFTTSYTAGEVIHKTITSYAKNGAASGLFDADAEICFGKVNGFDVDWTHGGFITFKTTNNNRDTAPIERLRIAETGNVGIGTTNPLARLQIEQTVAGGNGALVSIINRSAAVGTKCGIMFSVDNSGAHWGDVGNGQIIVENGDGGTAGIMKFRVYDGADSEAMKIAGNGTSNARNGVAFARAGIAFDNSWDGFPGIVVFATDGYGNSSNRTEFRVHGYGHTYAAYPGAPAADFGVNLRIDGATYISSDERHKVNIVDNPYGLNEILQLQPRKFNRINSQGEIEENQGDILGFIAQEVREVIPEAVNYYPEEDVPNEIGWCRAYSLSEGYLVSTLVNAVKQQQEIIDGLKLRIETLESQINT